MKDLRTHEFYHSNIKIWTRGGGNSSTGVMIDTLSQSSEVRRKAAGNSISLTDSQNINNIQKQSQLSLLLMYLFIDMMKTCMFK